MKKGVYIFCLFLYSVLYGYSQNSFTVAFSKEGKLIVLPKMQTFHLTIPELSYKSYTPASTSVIEAKLKEYKQEQTYKSDERPIDMQILSPAYRPLFSPSSVLMNMTPMMLDFKVTEFAPLNDNLVILTVGSKETFPGLGGITFLQSSLAWQSGRWALSGGAFAAKYYSPANWGPLQTVGFQGTADYLVADWLKLKTWGRYVNYNDNQSQNAHMVMNPFYPHTATGGAFEIRFNDKFGVGMGMQYEFNPIRRKWQPQYIAYPIFY